MEHAAATRVLSRAAESGAWGVPLGAITEFWSLATRAEDPARPQGQAALSFLRQIQQSGADIWVPEAGFGTRLVEIAFVVKIVGMRIFDLQIALTALEHGAEQIWTHRHFPRLPGLKIVDPL